MSSKYIVRQPIKDQANQIIGYEIQYYGENQAFGDSGRNVQAPATSPQQTPSTIS
ncbi:MAG: hypothetical protein ACLRWQ_15230 [Flavonifractor plautii]